MTHEFLAEIWFGILGVLLAGYAVLDGFDLGVGILHPFLGRTDLERRISLNSIGPIWDGNEVWLVTFGGAMFAMFPEAYASFFSGFYTAFMLLLFTLIFRAVSIEFRGKMHSDFWRRAWDWGFFLGSAGATLLFGVAVGNAIQGVPLNPQGEFVGSLAEQLNPYSILCGLLALSMFAMHGAIYLQLKTEGEFQHRVGQWCWSCWGIFLVLFFITTMYSLAEVPRATINFREYGWFWIVPILNVLAIANIPRALYHRQHMQAFISSSCAITAGVFLFGAALWPNMINASTDPSHSISIYNASSSPKTLTIGLLIVLLGMPFVCSYTAVIYWTFRGKVKLGEHSY
jgi:cytochrome d ubiquinol oxidase subunit II